uniref:Uncharacterized protein TCIL3000_10_5460 n=1 Tax=Trypanosoma congolense (strain IL3000) TaxID=1068625 RepID=G0UWL4_TRYCI|nr:unnamed protein product [Trypanosoma congolense IL3000]
MVFALCHVVPRNIAHQIALTFLFASCVLQLVVVASYGRESGVGTIRLHGSQGGSAGSVYISTLPKLRTAEGKTLCEMVKDSDRVYVGCARFVSSFRMVCGILVYSLILSVLAFFLGTFCVVPLCKTTMYILASEVLLASFPLMLHSAAVTVFFGRSLYYAIKSTKLILNDFSGVTSFECNYLLYIVLVSQALLVVGFSLCLAPFVIALFFRNSVKQRAIVHRDIGSVMDHHLVNNDWERQKTVLKSHARSVQLEIVIHEDQEWECVEPTSIHMFPAGSFAEEVPFERDGGAPAH